jgi:hypothetical protein
MADISRLFDFEPATTIQSGQVDAEFNQIISTVNNLDDANFNGLSGMYSAYRTIDRVAGAAVPGIPAADYHFSVTGLTQEGVGNSLPPLLLYLDDADYAITGRSLRLRVRGRAYVNGTGPGVTFTLGLFPVSSVGGAAGENSVTLGTVVSGSTVAFASPGANSSNQGNSGDFVFPADGHYALGVTISGSPAASTRVALLVELQVRWI